MKRFMGIINLGENESKIKEITYNRPIASVPIGGRYRVIDFTLSNMVNAGIQNVAIFTQGKNRSLMGHLGSAKPWDLNRKYEGLFVINPVLEPEDTIIRKGDIESFKNNIDYIQGSKQEYVLLTKSYMLYNMDFKKAFNYHIDSSSDITLIYKRVDNKDNRFIGCDNLTTDKFNNLKSIGYNMGNDEFSNISLETYILRKDLLIDIIKDTVSKGDSKYLKQAIYNRMDKLKVDTFPFNGYLACINSIENYYNTSMDLLDEKKYKDLFYENGLIYTKIKDEPSTKYSSSSNISNSLVANGCIIEGRVENSIIARGVTVKKGAVIKNSILMQKSLVSENAYLENIILDKKVIVSEGKILSGNHNKPFVIKKNTFL
ncbi:MAG: glucose-1-phosphate adenylyltransferase subunit GlgD [Firmicutes bacterium]|nr:glucose-1-phosphate adenylyltransferase subunit GlgD [Bacillota bacterium]